MIGPSIPARLLKNSQPTDESEDDVGPMPVAPNSPPRNTTPPAAAGPAIPEHLSKRPEPATTEEEEDEDAFLPTLPPDIAPPSKPSIRQIGPTLPSRPPPENSDSDEDYGPMPLPAGLSSSNDENDGVREFMEREKRRQENIEV
jgi:hypothetical protein